MMREKYFLLRCENEGECKDESEGKDESVSEDESVSVSEWILGQALRIRRAQ